MEEEESCWRNAGHCGQQGRGRHGILAGEELEDGLWEMEDRELHEAEGMEGARAPQAWPRQNMSDAAGLEEEGTWAWGEESMWALGSYVEQNI